MREIGTSGSVGGPESATTRAYPTALHPRHPGMQCNAGPQASWPASTATVRPPPGRSALK